MSVHYKLDCSILSGAVAVKKTACSAFCMYLGNSM
jgi:hypothetical protein